MLDQLDERDVRYAFRIPTNKSLQQWEEILAVREPGRPPAIPRTWTHNVTYQAATWEKPRRIVVVVQERPGELYLHTFFLLTSFTKEEMSADETVDFYRERALMENHIGEHQSVLNANLASTNRPKTHIKRNPISNTEDPIDAFGANAAALLLHGIAYNLSNTLRCLIDRGIEIEGTNGMHFKSVRRLFLAITGRFVISSRRITLRVPEVNDERSGRNYGMRSERSHITQLPDRPRGHPNFNTKQPTSRKGSVHGECAPNRYQLELMHFPSHRLMNNPG